MKKNITHKSVSCRSIRQDLSLLAGRDITDRERIETVRRHIAVCPQCRAKYRSLRDGLKVLTAGNEDNSSSPSAGNSSDSGTWVESGRSLWPELSERLPARPSSKAQNSDGWSLSRNWPPLVAMMAACGVMAVVLFAPTGPGEQTVGTTPVEAANFELEQKPQTIVDDKVVPAKAPGIMHLRVPKAD